MTTAEQPAETTNPAREDAWLVDFNTAARLLGVSRAGIYRLMTDDESFPKPFHILTTKRVFFRSELLIWVENRAQGR